jgi:hypothetical protein
MFAAFALVVVPSAGATTLFLRDGTKRPQPYQHWVDAAKVPTPRGFVKLVLTENGCAGYICAYPTETPARIVMFSDSFDRYTRYDTLHELGHVYDAKRLRPRDRRAWARIFGRWDMEQFAQSYSWCAMNPSWPAYRNYPGYGYWPTVSQHRRVCALIRRRGSGRARRRYVEPKLHFPGVCIRFRSIRVC